MYKNILKPIFDFVMLSHAHADHAQGLKSLMRSFGTKNFRVYYESNFANYPQQYYNDWNWFGFYFGDRYLIKQF